MDWLPSSWSQSLNKRVCRFIIHRYLGHILKEKLDLKQLTVDLYDGIGTIKDLNVDVEFVNSCVSGTPVPVRVVDGYIGQIDVVVPWKNLLSESCRLTVDRAELTLAACPSTSCVNSNDLMSSMIDSMMASMSSSLDLAKNFLSDEAVAGDELDIPLASVQSESDDTDGKTLADEGVEAFAHIIDAILCRMRIELTNTVIRLETPASSSSSPQQMTTDLEMNALELRIDRLEFLDEQLESVLKSHETPEAITTQPHSLSAVTDLNKLIHVTGIHLYTDAFHRPDDSVLNELCGVGSSQICTSMYIRRNLKQKSASPSPLECSTASSAFQSCYSQLDSDAPKPCSSGAERYCSEPVLFAQIAGERQTMRLKLKNDAPSGANPHLANIDMQMFFGNLYLLLSPAQLAIVETVVRQMFVPVDGGGGVQQSRTGNKPMMSADFDLVENELQNDLNQQLKRNSQFGAGNWSGEDAFYQVHRRPSQAGQPVAQDQEQQFTSIVVDHIEPAHYDKPQPVDLGRQTQSSEPLEVTHCKLKLNSIFCVFAYHDPAFYVDKTPTLHEWSTQFFKTAAKLPFAGIRSLTEVRTQHDAAFSKDHLRLVASPVVVDMDTETVLNSASDGSSVKTSVIALHVSAARAEIIEALNPSSVMLNSELSTSAAAFVYTPLLVFGNEHSQAEFNEEPCLRLAINNRQAANRYAVRCELGECTCELDVSVLERLYDLIHVADGRGSESMATSSNTLQHNDMTASLQLRDDLFAGISPSRAASKAAADATSLALDIQCPKMTINFRFPVADLRSLTSLPARPPWWIRQVHPEYLRVQVENARVRMQETALAALSSAGLLHVNGTSVTAWLDGLSEELRLDHPVLYSLAPNSSALCALNVKWDTRNKSLKVQEQHQQEDADSMTKSMWSSYIKPPTNQATHSGPFSSRVIMFEDEQITAVGSRSEIRSFRDECLASSDLNLVIDLPDLRLYLPDHDTYEVIYNRLVNDLALWEPCAALYHEQTACSGAVRPDADQYYSIHVPTVQQQQSGVSEHLFAMCKSNANTAESDNDSDSETATLDGGPHLQAHGSKTAHCSRASNKFCLLLSAANARAVLGTRAIQAGRVLHNNNVVFSGADAEVFVVSGWSKDANVAMVHILAERFSMAQTEHKAAGEPLTDVRCSRFAQAAVTPAHVKLQPVADNFAFKPLRDEPNLAVAIELKKNADNSKDVVCAVCVSNTVGHVEPLSPPHQLWLCQLIDMFDVVDWPIAGYAMPRVITQLHVQAANCQLLYDHVRPLASVAEPTQCRLLLDNVYVCSRIVAACAQLRLRITLEDLRLYLARLPADYGAKHVKFDAADGRQPAGLCTKDFVCAAWLGLLHLEVNVAEELLSGAVDPNKHALKSPLLEVTAKNDVLKLWTCADTLATLIGTLHDLAVAQAESAAEGNETKEADEAEACSSSSGGAPGPEVEPVSADGLDAQLRTHLQEMVQSAIRDHAYDEPVAATHTHPPHATLPTAPEGALDDDEAAGGGEDVLGGLADAMLDSMCEEQPPPQQQPPVVQPRSLSTGSDSDESFCVVDEIPGSGIANASGEPRVRSLLTDADEQVQVEQQHLAVPQHRINLLSTLPDTYQSPPLFRYVLRDVSLVWSIYGGSDFGEDGVPLAAYSSEAQREPLSHVPSSSVTDADGGPHRDQSVCLQLHVHKLCYVHELFACDAPAVCRHVLTVADAQVRNCMRASKLHKCLYQYSSEAQPERTCVPLFCWRMLETVPGEFKIKISALPLRLHMDQDTLEFVHDFFTAVGGSLPDAASEASPSTNRNTSAPTTEIQTPPRPAAVAVDTERSPDSSSASDEPEQHDLLTQSAITVAALFEDELETSMSASTGVSFSKAEQSVGLAAAVDVDPQQLETTRTMLTFDPSAPQAPNGDEIYIVSFEFSPAVTLRIDYQGASRVNLAQGAVQGLFIGLSQLNCTQLTLKQLHYRQGLLGANRCVQYCVSEWLNDIRRNQLPRVVSSVGPLSALAQIGSGIKDLFVMPVAEYQRVDGHVFKGVQKGAHAFGVASASASIDITQKLVGLVQGLAEFAYDVVSPSYPYHRCQQQQRALTHPAHAQDLRQGLNLAYDTMRQGVADTRDLLHYAVADDRASGRSAIRGLLRHATPTVLRPIVLAGRATSHVLDGLRVQLEPEARHELHDKWKTH